MVVNRQIKWKDMPGLIIHSQIVAATILFIIAMAKMFTWLLAMKQTPMLVQNAIQSLALPSWGLLLLVMVGLLIVGCIMGDHGRADPAGAGPGGHYTPDGGGPHSVRGAHGS